MLRAARVGCRPLLFVILVPTWWGTSMAVVAQVAFVSAPATVAGNHADSTRRSPCTGDTRPT